MSAMRSGYSACMNKQRKDEGIATRDNRPGKTLSAPSITRMMTTERDTLSKAAARIVANDQRCCAKDKRLDDWLADAKTV